ncbi:amino acid ABC transporter permease/ATP-binding protein [Planotetraspora sp. A-T 1434]|uniref:amino acid ABC transporter permease/ATP-binding protein n=1 Tax=Planotetraspora sp. A-T 1434 TaxID=2979219 RepID=UPI0028FC17E7|nr:amino acid ABC transporter permease/ATP-binding protein [Planotetraspora sp. A-T 1434]
MFQVPWSDYTGELLDGLLKTVEYTVVGFAGAVALGLVLALMRLSGHRLLRWPAAAYTEVFKNIPLLAIVFVTYFGLGSVGVRLDVFSAGALSLVVFYAAYLSETFRSAIAGVHHGQREAAEALGLSRINGFTRVIFPQALRLALPGTNTMLVDLLKSTSLLVTISAAELMSEARLITSATFRALEVYLVIAGLYFLLCYPLSQGLLWFERRIKAGTPLSPRRRRRLRSATALLAEGGAAGSISESVADAGPGTVLRIESLRKSFDGRRVLDGVSLTVDRGKIISVIGQSGGGKTTLLRCVNLLERPDAGVIEVNGGQIFSGGGATRDLAQLRRSVGMVFQRFNLFPHLTAVENVMLAQTLAGVPERTALERAVHLLCRVGLAHRGTAYPEQMSGGEQQRVAIARALALRPAVLLFDEPTSSLDPESTSEVLRVMRELAEDGMTMILVTHELTFARDVADWVVFVDGGRIIEEGPPGLLLGSPREPRTRAFLASHLSISAEA